MIERTLLRRGRSFVELRLRRSGSNVSDFYVYGHRDLDRWRAHAEYSHHAYERLTPRSALRLGRRVVTSHEHDAPGASPCSCSCGQAPRAQVAAQPRTACARAGGGALMIPRYMWQACALGFALALLVTCAMLVALVVVLPTSAEAHTSAQAARTCAEDAPCWTWSRMGNRKRGITTRHPRASRVVGVCGYWRVWHAGNLDPRTPRLRGDRWARRHGREVCAASHSAAASNPSDPSGAPSP